MLILCEFVFGLQDIVADIRILTTGLNNCPLGEGRILSGVTEEFV